MSKLQVNDIVDKDDVSAPGFSKGANITGVCTATSFSGNLTGNVTGTLSGTASGLAGSPDIAVGQVTAGVTTFTDSGASVATFNSTNTNGPLINIKRSGTNIGFLGSGKHLHDTTGSADALGLRSQAEFTIATNGDSEKVRVDTSGNVGVGTSIPAASSSAYDGATLHLGQPSSSAKGSQLKFTTGSSGHAAADGAYLAYYSNNHLYIYNREDEGISFGTNNTERVVFDSGGNVNITGITTASSFSDSLGTLRSLPVNSQTSAYTLVAADAGKLIKITTGGVICPNGESFVAGDMISIMNESDASQTVSTTGGSTLYWTADGTTGTRTLGPRGVATIVMSGSSAFYISGSGLT